jgi:STE24 endopeptidase
MSEMTATRMIRAGILAAVGLAWAAAAALLWRTDVPADLSLPSVELHRYFGADTLERYERHDTVLRWLGLAAITAELLGLLALALRPPRVRGHRLVQAAQLAVIALLGAFIARLPFALAIVWWQRRSGIARVGYAQWLLDRLPALAVRAAVLALSAVVVVALARRLGRQWWIVGAPAFVVVAAAVVLLQPLLTPRVEPLRERPRLVAAIEAAGKRQGLRDVRVEVRDAKSRSRQLNAEALGVGPTTRIILWDTTLELPPAIVLYLAAHELAHVSRIHLWKGLAWFVLFVLPLSYVLARLVDLRDHRHVPLAILVGALLALAITPATSTLSRRYEAEADWVALEATNDPDAAVSLFIALAAASERDPSPPAAYTAVFGTHPTIRDRIAMAQAFRIGRRSRGDS